MGVQGGFGESGVRGVEGLFCICALKKGPFDWSRFAQPYGMAK